MLPAAEYSGPLTFEPFHSVASTGGFLSRPSHQTVLSAIPDEKFGMEYVDRDGTKKNPYIIHRTSIGCYERTLALLIEKYAGAFPLWLAPEQVRILPVSEKYNDYAEKVKKELFDRGLRVEADYRPEKIGYKIREAQLQKVPYMLIVGEKEEAAGTVSVRKRGKGDIGAVAVEELLKTLKEEIDTKARD